MGFLTGLFGRKKPERAASTIGIAGHGLLIAPVCPCRATHLDNGSLLVGNIRNVSGPAAIVRPGSEPAPVGEPTEETMDGVAVFRYGAAGPLISTGPNATPLEAFFARVDAGLGEAPWSLLCAGGFWVDLPTGFTLMAAAPDEDDLLPEIHLVGKASHLVPDSFISFQLRSVPPDECELGIPPGINKVGEGELHLEEARIARWSEVEYEHEGERWRRRYYVLPLAPDRTLIVNGGARLSDFPLMVAGSERVAKSFSPTN